MCWFIAGALWRKQNYPAAITWYLAGFIELSLYCGVGIGYVIFS